MIKTEELKNMVGKLKDSMKGLNNRVTTNQETSVQESFV